VHEKIVSRFEQGEIPLFNFFMTEGFPKAVKKIVSSPGMFYPYVIG